MYKVKILVGTDRPTVINERPGFYSQNADYSLAIVIFQILKAIFSRLTSNQLLLLALGFPLC